MEAVDDDLNRAMMLDGNAVAGRFFALFGAEMTANLTECASCGQDHMNIIVIFLRIWGWLNFGQYGIRYWCT